MAILPFSKTKLANTQIREIMPRWKAIGNCLIIKTLDIRTAWWGAVNCGYFAYRENKKRDASPYLNEDLKRGWAYGWDTAAKACKSGKLPVFGP